MSAISASTNVAEMLARSLELGEHQISPDVAQFFLDLKLSDPDRIRLEELAEKARQGELSPTDKADLDEYIRFGRMVDLMKLKARMVLKSA